MTSKYKILNWIFCTFLCFSFAACNSDSTTDYEYDSSSYTNALVKSFVFAKNDSIDYGSGRDSVIFSIDQTGITDPNFLDSHPGYGIIFNTDSLPYGTVPDSIKVRMTFSYPSAVKFYHYDVFGTLADSTNFATSDTLWFSLFDKTILTVTAADGVTTKNYLVKVNIHKVNGDTMIWRCNSVPALMADAPIEAQTVGTLEGEPYWFVQRAGLQEVWPMTMQGEKLQVDARLGEVSGATLLLNTMRSFGNKLYAVSATNRLASSADALAWTEVGADLHFVNILGTTEATGKLPATLFAIVNQDGINTFASSTDGANWTMGEAIPANFPVSGFSNPVTTAAKPALGTVTSRLYIVGGRTADGTLTNSTWTTDGTSWVEFTQNQMPAMEGASIIKYTYNSTLPERLWILYPGATADGAIRNIYFSENNGVTWRLFKSEFATYADNSMIAPVAFHAPYFDESHWRMYFIGGIADGAQQPQIIDAQLTKLMFDVIK